MTGTVCARQNNPCGHPYARHSTVFPFACLDCAGCVAFILPVCGTEISEGGCGTPAHEHEGYYPFANPAANCAGYVFPSDVAPYAQSFTGGGGSFGGGGASGDW